MSDISKTACRALMIASLTVFPLTGLAQTADAPVAPDAAVPEAPPEVAAKPVEGQITMQSDETILTSDLIDGQIENAAGEAVGKVKDVIVSLDGSVEGVVIGVGGFLGMGEKSVAIEMSSLSVAADEEGNAKLVTAATREDLEAAQAFVTVEQRKAVERSLETNPETGATDTQPVTQ